MTSPDLIRLSPPHLRPRPRPSPGWTCVRLCTLLMVAVAATSPQPAIAEEAGTHPLVVVGATASPVLLGSCGGTYYPGRHKPAQWDMGCTGVSDLTRMVWHSWGRPTGSGTGVTQLNDCSPTCAEGMVQEFPAAAEVSRIRRCRGNSGQVRRFYTRVRIVYDLPPDNPYGRPGGRQDGVYKLTCRSPTAPVSCGTVGKAYLPGHAFDVVARRLPCARARRLAARAKRQTCRRGCTTRKTLRVAGYHCRYGPYNRSGFYVPVRCTRGRRAVTFRVALD